MISEDKLWETVRHFNELSSMYKQLANELSAIIRQNHKEEN